MLMSQLITARSSTADTSLIDCEVFILRNDHGSDLGGLFPNIFVRRGQQSTVSNVLSAVSERFNSSSERWGELSVDEKPPSCAPQNWMIVLLGGELEDRCDVVGLEIRIVREDLFVAGPGGKEVEHECEGRECTDGRHTHPDSP